MCLALMENTMKINLEINYGLTVWYMYVYNILKEVYEHYQRHNSHPNQRFKLQRLKVSAKAISLQTKHAVFLDLMTYNSTPG